MFIKDIIPLKIIIDIKEDYTYKNAILLYKIYFESGEISNKTYSISIDSKISKPIINGILNDSKIFTKMQEEKNSKSK